MDPLAGRLSGMLHLGRPRHPAARARRLSDTDRPPQRASFDERGVSTVRSRDGSRWLPLPDERSLTVRPGEDELNQTPNRQAPTAHPPLEPHNCPATKTAAAAAAAGSPTCAVARFFATPELLELTLSFLESTHLPAVRLTSTFWHSTIQQSPRLRLRFFASPQWYRPPEDFQLLPLSLRGLTIARGEPVHLGCWVEITVAPEAARRIVPDPKPISRPRARSIYEGLRGGLGSAAQREGDSSWPAASQSAVGDEEASSPSPGLDELLVMQPPLSSMQAFVVEAGAGVGREGEHLGGSGRAGEDGRPQPRGAAKVTCYNGITLGFLAEAAHSLLAPHDGGPSDAREKKLLFRAIVSFCDQDPKHRKRGTARTITRLD